jgi:hypothetical protein
MHRTIPAALIVTMLAVGDDAPAGDAPVLILPMRDALAIVERPATSGTSSQTPIAASAWRGAAPGAPPPPPAFIPRRIHIPDLYRVDYERDAPRFAEPVDNDKMVALELVPSTPIRPSMSFRFDKESLPLGDSSSRLSVEFELPF